MMVFYSALEFVSENSMTGSVIEGRDFYHNGDQAQDLRLIINTY